MKLLVFLGTVNFNILPFDNQQHPVDDRLGDDLIIRSLPFIAMIHKR